MSPVEQIELLNSLANIAISISPLWAGLYLLMHALKPHPQPDLTPVSAPAVVVTSQNRLKASPTPKGDRDPRPARARKGMVKA